MKTQVLIVGGGLSGLHTAYELHKRNIDFLLLEARTRFGGRILSRPWQPTGSNPTQHAYDMGPAWFWPGQVNIEGLVRELDLVDHVFYQQNQGDAIYENPEGYINRGVQGISMAGSYRLQGGNAQLIAALQEKLPDTSLKLGTTIKQIQQLEQTIQVSASYNDQVFTIESDTVVIAAPPRVALQQVRFEPAFSKERTAVLNNIKTWMAGHAKLLAFYETPFWLEQGYSGDCISQIGLMHEIHDASPKQGGPYALFGFIGVPASDRNDLAQLKRAAIAQLVRLFGEQAASPLDIYYKDWAKDELTATTLDQEMLTAHPSNDLGSRSEESWKHRLIWSGSEASNGRFNGYLEGALEASVNTLKRL